MNILEWQRVTKFICEFGESASISIHLDGLLKKLVLYKTTDEPTAPTIRFDFIPTVFLEIENNTIKPALYLTVYYINGLREYGTLVFNDLTSKPFIYNANKYHNTNLSKNAYVASFSADTTESFLNAILHGLISNNSNVKVSEYINPLSLQSVNDFIGSVHSLVASLLSEFHHLDVSPLHADQTLLKLLAQQLHIKYSLFDPLIVCSSKDLLVATSDFASISTHPVYKQGHWRCFISSNHHLQRTITSEPVFDWQLMDGIGGDGKSLNYNAMPMNTDNFQALHRFFDSSSFPIKLNASQISSLKAFSFNDVESWLLKKVTNAE